MFREKFSLHGGTVFSPYVIIIVVKNIDMPKELEAALRSAAKKKGLSGDRLNAYVYGNKQMQAYLRKKRHGSVA